MSEHLILTLNDKNVIAETKINIFNHIYSYERFSSLKHADCLNY